MYKSILIATDGSELADKAIDQGIALGKALGAKVTIVTVTEPWATLAPADFTVAFPIEDYERAAKESAVKLLESASKKAQAAGVACDTLHVADRYPADGILEAAKAVAADLIVMASHGRRGVARVLIGSQTNRVVIHSTIPVLVCR